jgi:hypothetical protein
VHHFFVSSFSHQFSFSPHHISEPGFFPNRFQLSSVKLFAL